MKLSPRERAMLREMGVDWPETQHASAGPVALDPGGHPAPSRAHASAAAIQPDAPNIQRAPVGHDANPPLLHPGRAAHEHQQSAEGLRAGELPPSTDAIQAAAPWPAQPSWDELQSAVSSCQRCSLCANRRNTVFGVGHPRAAWMVVGEAPGEQEDRQGVPFVGAAGQLLDRMLGSIGLSREVGPAGGAGDGAQPVFITNTVKCRPPQNRNPEPSELAACEPVLHRQMELVRPRLVLAMGRFAAQQLLHTQEPIGRLRGRVHRLSGAGADWAGEAGVPVVVTYHPAYLLRNPIDKAKAWDDLCLALDTMAALPTGG